MMNSIYALNLVAVGFFGIVLSVSFCDIIWTQQRHKIMAGGVFMIMLFQVIIFMWGNVQTVHFFYPLITHLPLAVTLFILTKKRLWSVVSVLTAYLFCQTRRWLALLIVAVCGGGDMMQNVAELVFTLPLLFILVRFIAPSMRSISRKEHSLQWQFGLIPALYYGFDYMTQIFPGLFSDMRPVVIEFMPFVCSVAYLLFVLRTSETEKVRMQYEQTQNSLDLQIGGAVREIAALRESQRKGIAYRHDLRHHLQYLAVCIENERLEQAQAYIRSICSEIEADKVTNFCENEAVNLIFSAFAGRAENAGISMEIKATLSQTIHVAESDLCVLLSNALENALHACQKRKEAGFEGVIEVSVYEKGGKVFLQVSNSCEEDILFVRGLPVTEKQGHGIGVRSICAIAERYGGIYSFSAGDGLFVLRVSL